MDDPVQAQYEAYPYPARDPADEVRRLVTGSPSHLDEINHTLFAGQRDFSQPFRALVAGGGTGDAAIMLAQQLAERGSAGRVDYLDLADGAREIAEARATIRGLRNIAFHRGKIEDLLALGLAPFDYIDCCGVLHHLADPSAGLTALADSLAPNGGIGLMVYGEYGRTGVYPAQAALRALGRGLDLPSQVQLTRRLLAELPATNWLRRNPFLGDHKLSDAELVDLFLHTRDRAYTVTQLLELASAAGLELVRFIEPVRYDPASYLSDPALAERASALAPPDQAALAEALAGNMKKHVAYVVPRGTAGGRIARLAGTQTRLLPARLDLARAIDPEYRLKVAFDGLEIVCTLPPLGREILQLADGRRSLEEIHRGLQSGQPALDWLAFQAQAKQLVGALEPLNLLWLSAGRARL